MKQEETNIELIDCPACNGTGIIVDDEIVAECCGFPLRNGLCCGNPIPGAQQFQRQCSYCAAEGKVPANHHELLIASDTQLNCF